MKSSTYSESKQSGKSESKSHKTSFTVELKEVARKYHNLKGGLAYSEEIKKERIERLAFDTIQFRHYLFQIFCLDQKLSKEYNVKDHLLFFKFLEANCPFVNKDEDELLARELLTNFDLRTYKEEDNKEKTVELMEEKKSSDAPMILNHSEKGKVDTNGSLENTINKRNMKSLYFICHSYHQIKARLQSMQDEEIEEIKKEEWVLIEDFKIHLNENLRIFNEIFGSSFPPSQVSKNLSRNHNNSTSQILTFLKKFYEDFISHLKKTLNKRIMPTYNNKPKVVVPDLFHCVSNSGMLETQSPLLNSEVLLKIKWKTLDELIDIYKQKIAIPTNKRFTDVGKFKIEMLNIVTADVVFKFKVRTDKVTIKSVRIPVYNLDNPAKLIYSESDLNDNEDTQSYVYDQAATALKDFLEAMNYQQNRCTLGLGHSEKALIGFLLENMSKIVQQTVIFLGKDLVVEELLEIGLEIYSTNECCALCESFLKNSFERIFQLALPFLRESFGDLQLPKSKPYILNKYFVYSLGGDPPANSAKKNEHNFKIDRKNLKSFLEIPFLEAILFMDLPRKEKRTYFISSPPQMTEEIKARILEASRDMNLS